MQFYQKLTTLMSMTLCATTAWSADYQVTRTLELTAPATEVWNLIGDFCDIDDWHPSVSACSLKVVDGSLVRVIITRTGDEIIQKRIAEEPGLSYTYTTVSSSMPLQKFTATLSLEPFDKPLLAWSARFSSDDPGMEQAVVGEFEAGIAAIEKILTIDN